MTILQELKRRKTTIDVIFRASTAMRIVSTVRIRRINKQMKDLIAFSQKFEKIKNQIFEEIYLPYVMDKDANVNINVLIGCDKGLCGDFFQSLKTYFNIYFKKSEDNWLFFGEKLSSLAKHTRTIFEGKIPTKDDEIFTVAIRFWRLIKHESVGEITLHYFTKQGIVAKKIFSRALIQNALQENIKPQAKTFSEEETHFELPEEFGIIFLMNELNLALHESALQENTKRSIAMEQATRNAKEMSNNILRLYHRERQEMITGELSEITAGIIGL